MEKLYIQPFNIEKLNKTSIEYYLGKQILKDIFLEFSLNENNEFERIKLLETKGKLLEERCLIPNFKEYIDIFWKYLIGGFERNMLYFTTQVNIFKNLTNVFFENLILHIEYHPFDEYYSAYYSPEYAKYNAETDKIKLLYISIKIGCKKDEIKSNFTRAFAHELTHAYEDFQRQKNNRESFTEINKKSNHINLKPFSENQIESFVSNICYNLNKYEENAYLAGLYGELIGMKTWGDDSKTAYEHLRKTDKYQTLLYLKKNIEYLKINGFQNKELEDIFIKTYNRINDSNLQSSKRIIRLLDYKFEKLWRDFRNKASKILYDVMLEKRKTTTIPDIPTKFIKNHGEKNI